MAQNEGICEIFKGAHAGGELQEGFFGGGVVLYWENCRNQGKARVFRVGKSDSQKFPALRGVGSSSQIQDCWQENSGK